MRPAKNLLPLILLAAICFFSCKKNPAVPDIPENNQWILDSMKVYYYWADALPQQPRANGSASDFFKSLLHPADRFSYLDDPDQPVTEYSSFAYYGFEYALIETPAFPGRLLGMVTLVVPGGPAAKKGIKRGDVFGSVNGIALSSTTAEQIKKILRQGNNIQLQMAKIINNQLIDSGTYDLSYAYFREQPTYITRLFSNGTKKTGYIFYNNFNEVFDRNVLDSIAKFKGAGLSDLILDLRYNPGGSVSSAAKIAVALAPVQATQTFVISQANKNGGQLIDSFAQSIAKSTSTPNSFSLVKDAHIDLQRLIVLTSSATASAAELIINNLKPYLTVVQIGEKTIGKDMASFEIYDQRMPKKINYILHPLIFKLYNANMKGDYSQGLVPDYAADEFSVLPLKDFGDPNDVLIKKALEVSLGTSVGVASNKIALSPPILRESSRTIFKSSSARSLLGSPIVVGNAAVRSSFKRH